MNAPILTLPLINKVVHAFYQVAIYDILIGYHFRVIEDFDTHIPRIADFWQLQLTGKMDNPGSLPFDLIQIHIPLKVKRGEIDRWGILFKQILDQFVNAQEITQDQSDQWMNKIEIFKTKLIERVL